MPTIVQLELSKWLTREVGEGQVNQAIAYTQKCIVVPLDTAIALPAADLHREHKLAMPTRSSTRRRACTMRTTPVFTPIVPKIVPRLTMMKLPQIDQILKGRRIRTERARRKERRCLLVLSQSSQLFQGQIQRFNAFAIKASPSVGSPRATGRSAGPSGRVCAIKCCSSR